MVISFGLKYMFVVAVNIFVNAGHAFGEGQVVTLPVAVEGPDPFFLLLIPAIIFNFVSSFITVAVDDDIVWEQVGIDMEGDTYDRLGQSIALSGNGMRMGVGGSVSGFYKKGPRMFAWNEDDGVWSEEYIKLDITIGALALSNDGLILIASDASRDAATNMTGAVFVYEHEHASSNWTKKGETLYGDEPIGDTFGATVNIASLSLDDGDRIRIAVGDFLGSYVKVMDLVGDEWILHYKLDGCAGSESSLSMSADGSTLIMGAQHNGFLSHGSAFFYTLADGEMIQEIKGNIGDQFGSKVSISANGTRAAVGSFGRRYVKVYELTSSGKYRQRGRTIQEFGSSSGAGGRSGPLAISSNGLWLVVGYPYNKNGATKIFSIGDDCGSRYIVCAGEIDGDELNDYSGAAVAVSEDGKRLAIGAPLGSTSRKGYVRVYESSYAYNLTSKK